MEMQSRGTEPTEVTYSAAITACFNRGRYREACDLFEGAQRKGHYPNFALQATAEWDLHGFDLPESCMLLAQALISAMQSKSYELPSFGDIVVITGKGHGSGPEGPVLQKYVPRFLRDCSGPEITRIEGNDGAFAISHESLRDWYDSSRWKVFRSIVKGEDKIWPPPL